VSLGLIKTFNKYVSPYYLVIWLNSPIGREKCSANTYGVGHSQGNLNLSLINNFVIPLPPFNEQKRIVAKVRQLLILCDELEQRVMENQKNSEFLMEAVLKETFSSLIFYLRFSELAVILLVGVEFYPNKPNPGTSCALESICASWAVLS